MNRKYFYILAVTSSFSFIQTLDAQEANKGFQVSSVNPKSDKPPEQKSLEILQAPSEIILKTQPPNSQLEKFPTSPVLAKDFDWGVKIMDGVAYRAGIQKLEPLAKSGHADAQFQLGLMIYNGWGTPRNYRRAAVWYREAAIQGYDNSQYALGNLYDNGEGVPQDKTEAAVWWRKAAEQGHVLAQLSLARRYSELSDGHENLKQTARWYQAAAVNGSTIAQIELAKMYQLGRGLPQDNAMAHMWYNIAGATAENPDYWEIAFRKRDDIGNKMTSADLADAQRMATQCMIGGYKNCGY